MNISTKLLQAAAGQAGGAGLDVDEVFSTFVYEGNGSTGQSIVNGIDLSGEGGLVWAKSRESSSNHSWYDTVRGVQKALFSNSTGAEQSDASGGATKGLYQFNNNGFTVGDDWAAAINLNNDDMVSWTFRKAPKFFDIVTYSGTGSAQNISHSLGSVPGIIIVKRTSANGVWSVYHRGANGGTNPEQYHFHFNNTDAQSAVPSFWNDTAPTDSVFTVGTDDDTNKSGETFVAYLFAHNDGDGGFGPDSDQDIIKCGSYTNGASGVEVNLGFEPQWMMFKKTDGSGNWGIVDVMRGIKVVSSVGDNSNQLRANLSNAENAEYHPYPTPTGFKTDGSGGGGGGGSGDYIYMAIRRGPLAEPTDATDVFATGVVQNNTGRTLTNPLGHPSDWAFLQTSSGGNWIVQSRLTESADLKFNSSAAEVDNKGYGFANNTNYEADGTAAIGAYGWNFRRAPGYFDVVAEPIASNQMSGPASSSYNPSHNLGVVPEMIWVKDRDNSNDWAVYHSALGTSKKLVLNSSAAESSSSWAVAADNFNYYQFGNSTGNAICYLFATVAGVSKVGSYTGTGAQQNIDCGFSSGARFVLIKRSSGTGHWRLMDSQRGIVSGVDKTLLLNTTNAEITDEDTIDPHSSGFSVPNNADVNASGSTYIFYAIA